MAGPDRITPKMLKEPSQKAITPLTYLFNVILRQNYWPKQIKIAEIILTTWQRPYQTYRPISLLSSFKNSRTTSITNNQYGSPY